MAEKEKSFVPLKPKVIRRCEIKECSFPEGFDGKGVYHYSAEVINSVDGGKTFWHCGEGKYCMTRKEAEEYRRDIESEEPK